MLLNNKKCIDAGTVNCPCYLAEYGKCQVCSRLGGSCTCCTVCSGGSELHDAGCDCDRNAGTPAACNCQWQGVCIYNEYMQNKFCIYEQRESRLCEIQKIKWFEDDLAVMRISVPRGMAERASLPGSFVFVKSPEMESYFDFPVSVLRSDFENSALELAVKVLGPKSRALLDRDRGYVELRGVYRNGLLGAEKLLGAGDRLRTANQGGTDLDAGKLRVLCFTKGIGIAPVANYIRWADGRDRIDVIADLDKISREFAEYVLGAGGINSVTYCPLPLELPWAEQEKYDVIIISASDYYQQNIYVPEAKKVLSNNTSMCCGEGICGACICMDANGTAHRMCKECEVR